MDVVQLGSDGKRELSAAQMHLRNTLKLVGSSPCYELAFSTSKMDAAVSKMWLTSILSCVCHTIRVNNFLGLLGTRHWTLVLRKCKEECRITWLKGQQAEDLAPKIAQPKETTYRPKLKGSAMFWCASSYQCFLWLQCGDVGKFVSSSYWPSFVASLVCLTHLVEMN